MGEATTRIPIPALKLGSHWAAGILPALLRGWFCARPL